MIRIIHPAWGCKIRFELNDVGDKDVVERALVEYNEARKANPLLAFAPYGAGLKWQEEHPTVSQEHWDQWEAVALRGLNAKTRKGVKALCTIVRTLDSEGVKYEILASSTL